MVYQQYLIITIVWNIDAQESRWLQKGFAPKNPQIFKIQQFGPLLPYIREGISKSKAQSKSTTNPRIFHETWRVRSFSNAREWRINNRQWKTLTTDTCLPALFQPRLGALDPAVTSTREFRAKYLFIRLLVRLTGETGIS